MRTLAENSNNDLFLGSDNNLDILTDLDATLQSCKSAIETQRGELQYDVNRGVPTSQTIWNGIPNEQRFRFYCLEAVRGVPGVEKITQFDIEIRAKELVYTMTIVTIFGTDTVGNIINGV